MRSRLAHADKPCHPISRIMQRFFHSSCILHGDSRFASSCVYHPQGWADTLAKPRRFRLSHPFGVWFTRSLDFEFSSASLPAAFLNFFCAPALDPTPSFSINYKCLHSNSFPFIQLQMPWGVYPSASLSFHSPIVHPERIRGANRHNPSPIATNPCWCQNEP